MTAAPLKAQTREAALARRAALGEAERARASAMAVSHLAALVRAGEAVALFCPIHDEIDPTGLSDVIRAAGGTVLLPAVTGTDIVFRVHQPCAALEPGAFGTLHPPATAPEGDPDLIIAPLSVYDSAGNRIGYGGGFYDRAAARLEAARHPFRFVGVAFACQHVECAPAEAHDRKLDAIATENGLVRFREQT